MTVLKETIKWGEQIPLQGKIDVVLQSTATSSAVGLKWIPWVMLND